LFRPPGLDDGDKEEEEEAAAASPPVMTALLPDKLSVWRLLQYPMYRHHHPYLPFLPPPMHSFSSASAYPSVDFSLKKV
jgi:hypothetical protein